MNAIQYTPGPRPYRSNKYPVELPRLRPPIKNPATINTDFNADMNSILSPVRVIRLSDTVPSLSNPLRAAWAFLKGFLQSLVLVALLSFVGSGGTVLSLFGH